MDKISTAKSHLYSNHAKKKEDTIKILGEGIREDVECIWPKKTLNKNNMSNWKVIKTKIKLFDHHNADKLDIARVGTYQCVVQKGLYKDGDEVVFAPEKSVLTGRLKDEYSKWLAGPNKDRVHPVVMRGEHSCGIIIPNELIEDLIGDLAQVEEGVDISERLGITKYVPLVPFELAGISEPLEISSEYGKHDCEQFSIYANEFTDGERIVVTEKLHGCVSGDTILNTLEYGDITIKKIVDGRLNCHVKSKDLETNEIVYSKIDNFFYEQNSGDWYQIELEDGTLLNITGNNPVWIPLLNCYRRVDEITENDILELEK